MPQSKITFIVNGNTYSLSPDDLSGIKNIAAADRRELLRLLENIKVSGTQTHAAQIPVASTAAKQTAAVTPKAKTAIDPDILMAQLIKEERAARGEGASKKTFYKIIAGIALLVIVLIVVF